jgi:hypothetical protein
MALYNTISGYSFEKKIMSDKYSYHNNRGKYSSGMGMTGCKNFTIFTKFYPVSADGYYWGIVIDSSSPKFQRQLFISDNEHGKRFTIVGDDGRSRMYDSGMQLFVGTHDFLVIRNNSRFYVYLDGVLKYSDNAFANMISSSYFGIRFNPQPINNTFYGNVYFNELEFFDVALGPQYRSNTDYYARELTDPRKLFDSKEIYGKV